MAPCCCQESLGGLTSPIAILLASGIGAILAWAYHRHVSALKSTLDFVIATEVASTEWKQAQSLFARLFPKDANPRPAYAGEIPAKTAGNGITAEEVAMLSIYLGHFEFVAAAIKMGSMNEKLYKNWNRTVVISTWHHAQRYIEARREKTGQETLYIEFGKLAEKWARGKP